MNYDEVTPDQLKMERLPRKSKFHLVHVPSGEVAKDPVVPGEMTEARYRRPTILPKENRIKDMTGYVEGRGDDAKLYIITEGDSPRNEYLEAIAADKAALKACFEGVPQKDSQDSPPDPTPGDAPATAAEVLEEAEHAQPEDKSQVQAEAPKATEPVQPDEMKQLDELLAGMGD